MQSAIVLVILENEIVDEKICRRAKNRESRRRGSRGCKKTELQDLQLGARHCDVGQHYVIGVVAGSNSSRPIAGYI